MSFLVASVTHLVQALLAPAEALFDPSRRVFGPSLAGAVLLSAVVLAARGAAAGAVARALFGRRIWLHRSSLVDYQIIAAKALLRVFLFGSWGVSMVAVAGLAAGWLRLHLGESGVRAPSALVAAAFTLAAFLAEDWSRYYVHRLMHRVPLLWEFHKVHHSAEVLTPFTLYRSHPVEALLNRARSALAIGLVTGFCAWLFGPTLRAWELLGVDALGFVWSVLGANLRHSHVWLSYGPRVERWLLSPAQHQVHHSDDPRHYDRNFGTVLALWDRLGATLYVTTARREALRFGLPPGERPPGRGVAGQLVGPLVAVARRAVAVAGARRSAATLVCLAVASLSCTDAEPKLDRAALLQSFGRCTLDQHQSFRGAADGLVTATTAYAAAPDEATRAAARAAWERAIDAWQVAEMLQYGPPAALDTLGGRGLRPQIYAWPDVNRCLIEQQLVSRAYEGAAFGDLSASTRGLAALEYLLYYTGADNACDAANPINATGTWAALGADELARRRAAYARAAAVDVAARARALVEAWEPNGFLAQLTTAGRGSTLFPTQQVAISVVAEAVFHADTDVKDLRLGRPLGLVNCTTGTCPEALESPWADRGKRHLRNNVAGLRLLLLGCAAGGNLGYDDLLESAGAGALAARMRTSLDAVDAAIEAVPGDSLRAALASNRDALVRAHTAVRELTSFLKMEFSTTLQIQSQRVEGDHD